VEALIDMLRTHRLDVEVAATRMPWANDWPLDRLMCAAADALAAQAQQLAQAEQEREKYQIAAGVLCGAHIGVPQPLGCPVCRAEQTDRDSDAARHALADAAREINCAGPVAHRIRVLRQEHAQTVAQLTRERDDLWLAYQAERDKARA
jgi:multidrug efflux pump subunit AcrA (membrane-fusion protein)